MHSADALRSASLPTGAATLGTSTAWAAPANATKVQWGTIDHALELPAGSTVAVRLLCRRDMLELYLNDYLMPVYLMPPTTGRIGLLPAAAHGISEARLWAMSLPGGDEAGEAHTGLTQET